MTPRSTEQEALVRPLAPDDLERMVQIDQAHTGAMRGAFLGKRLAAALRHPDCYFSMGVEQQGTLVGFALGRLVAGEFGQLEPAAVLDAIGIEPTHEGHGLGHRLMDGIVAAVRARGARKLCSQADWTQHGLLKFFHSSGFALSPRLVLGRGTSLAFAEGTQEL